MHRGAYGASVPFVGDEGMGKKKKKTRLVYHDMVYIYIYMYLYAKV